MIASFLPMLLIASAFYFLNKVDQDCGTTFSWVTRAMVVHAIGNSLGLTLLAASWLARHSGGRGKVRAR